MGCDIHMFVEVKKDGQWDKVGDVFKNSYYRPAEEESEYNRPLTDEPYQGRNYTLFATLADVRNSGEGISPIDDPRDLPEDVSVGVKSESDSWNGDGHSHSWFTVKELQDYKWDTPSKMYGIVSMNEYKEFVANGRPTGWCGGVGGRSVRHISNKEMEQLIDGSTPVDSKLSYYTEIKWEVPCDDYCTTFVKETIPLLAELGDPEDVRIVFWFDN